ncbi:MAG TPA: branched chain amino acid aminotransferase [Cryomorphaceae bacterium]|nr:branched chain amino acid aminotransferase [Owenweeksia sp.]MBG00003.1 branched chain amino acid aminotransferase [Owenweeksia sp.]HAD97820.1 branched chain amino acid aminotransferase [Cryomorphaceae bacterium]HCQ15069.1 branched chain amino acid aminotransferase [Cryomorphaceae bacterium]|tara:strand:+ start:2035 stop:3084 length:1050 start_codon:yes stop_codon:yes gene_type:complete
MKVTKTTNSRISQANLENPAFGTQFSDHMLMCEYRNGSWEEPEIMPFGPISFTPALHTLHYGQALFEGQKAYFMKDGRVGIFRPDANAERLNHSARRMFMPEFPADWFVDGLKQLVSLDKEWIPKNEGCALYLRPFMFGSSEFVAARPSEKYTMCIITSPVGPYYAGDVKVKVEETYTRSASGGVGSTKCAGNYGGAFFATDQAKKEGYTQVIWTDHKNHELVEESGTMNVAFVINDTLITPPLSDRILAGITRDSILTLLRDNGLLKVEERPVSVTEVVQAARNGKLQEAFGMGTAAVVSQICTIGFRGEDFSIPVPKDGYAMKIKKQLTDIRMGDAEDKFNWMTILN